MLEEPVLKTVSEGVLPRLTKAFCEAIHGSLFVIKSEEVPQLLVVSAMRRCRVGDNRNALSGAGALASDGSGLSETTRLDCLRSRRTISVVCLISRALDSGGQAIKGAWGMSRR